LDAHDRIILSGIAAVFIGSLLYGWVFDELGLAAGIGVSLLGASLVVALYARGGMLSQVALPFLGMAMVSLMIQVSHGHNEAHFAVFAFLAILVTYRRMIPVLVGAAAIAVHHLTFNYFQSLGWGPVCFSQPSFLRVVEHAAFVVAETAVLLVLAGRAKADFMAAEELTQIAASLVRKNGSVDLSVTRRTAQSPAAEILLGALTHIATLIEQVRDAANAINHSTAELSSGNQSLSHRTEQTASSLQSTAASVEQITSTMLASSGSADQANGLVGTASHVATRGGEAVSRVVETMNDIQHSSRKITEIIGVIDGIAFQTNILALNAAVEAARAGDQGRGFAVVASEVRNLAQRSAAAAKEIKTLITDSVAQVQVGSALVRDAGQTIDEIVSQVRGVSSLIQEVTHSTKEQTQGIGQINEAIGHLEGNTQQNAALVEEIAASTRQLREQAQRLVGALAVFASGGACAEPLPVR
jgi:methyl-accepting chemotaxis protein